MKTWEEQTKIGAYSFARLFLLFLEEFVLSF